MSKKNKRFAALITAVLVLALTVAGSLTVSASSYCAWYLYDFYGSTYGSYVDDGMYPVERNFSSTDNFYILANGISVDSAGTDMLWTNNTGLEFVGLATSSKSSAAASGYGIGTTHTFGELVYSTNGSVRYYIALDKGNNLQDDVTFALVPSGSQLTAEVYFWDSNCKDLFFTVDGVKVGSSFMADIVGPVSKHVGTLADFDELTTGYHKIGVCQTNSEGAIKYSSTSTYCYFTKTSSGYVYGGTNTLGTSVPTELASLTKQTTSVTYVVRNGCIWYDFEHNGKYYFCREYNWSTETSPLQIYTVDSTTFQKTKTVNLYWSSSTSYKYSVFGDIFYYDGFLYVYGRDYSSKSDSSFNYSSSDLFRIPVSTLESAADGASFNLYNYSFGSGLPSAKLTAYRRRTYIRTDGTFYHILVQGSDATSFTYYRYNISSGAYETYSTAITNISDFQYENGFAYFYNTYTDTICNKTYIRLCSFNFSTRELSILASFAPDSLNHLASSLATSSVTDSYGVSVPAGSVSLSSFVRVGDGKYLCGYNVYSAPYRYSTSHNMTTTASVGSGTFLYTLSDNKITKVYESNVGTLYRTKYFLAIDDTSAIYKYTPFAVPRYYTEAEYQAALAAGACDKTHVTDTNNDGYDDSSYTAGYNSGAATASTASPLLSYSQGQLSWRKIKDSNSVYIEYMTYQDYLTDDGWTPLPNSTDYTDGFWEIDSYDWNYEKTHNSKWVQFRLVETTDSGDKYSNTIQIDVCLDTHVVDKNNDGYDDSAYSAGYTAGNGSGACSLIHVVDNDNDTYDDVSFTAGKQAGINYQKNKSSDSGVADFVTKILGAFTGSALYVGSNISVGGVTLLTIIGIIAIGGAVIIILKFSKGG